MIERWIARLDRWQRERSWAAFPLAVVKKFGDDEAGHLAALVAWFAFFSIFPLLLVLTTVLGWVLVSNPDLQERAVDSAVGQIPVIGDQVRENVGSLPGSGVALAIGLAGALWGGMGAVLAMQRALDGVWNVPRTRRPGFVAGRLRAVALLALFGTGLVLLAVSGPATRSLARLPLVGDLGAFAVSFVFAAGLFLVVFRLLTTPPVATRDLVPGAVVAAFAWAVLQAVGGAFVRRWVDGSDGTSGVFAVVLGLLSWLYLQAQVTVLAAEINVVRRERLWPRSLTGRDLGENDLRALARYAAAEQRVEGQDLVVDLRPPAVDGYVRTQARTEPGA